MKRWTLRITLLLILGAATTVAVAWGIALFNNPLHSSPLEIAQDSKCHVWKITGPESCVLWLVFGEYGEYYAVTPRSPESLLPRWRRPVEPVPVDSGVLNSRIIVQAQGYPLVAMWSEYHEQYSSISRRSETRCIGIRLARDAWESVPTVSGSTLIMDRMLPLRPIWPGFLINTFFYAAMWSGLFFGLAAARRIIRRRRGCCPRCAYDLRRDLARGCPECGWNRPPA